MEDGLRSSRSKQGVAWGIGAALVGSLCCVGPVVAVVMGLGSASFLLSFTAYRPLFLGASFLLMGAGAVIMVRRSRTCCSVEQQQRNLWAYLVVSLITFASSYGLLTYVIPILAYNAVGEAASPTTAAPTEQGLPNSIVEQTTSQGLRQAVLGIDGMT